MKIFKFNNGLRAYPTHQAVQTIGSTVYTYREARRDDQARSPRSWWVSRDTCVVTK